MQQLNNFLKDYPTFAKTSGFRRFLICSLFLLSAVGFSLQGLGQDTTFSYSYQNVTRVNGGGTLEKGDVIEIRALLLVRGNAVANVSYHDTIGTGTQYIPGSMKIVTNEGLLFRGPYTDADGDDPANFINDAHPRIRVNVGSGTTNATTANYTNRSSGGTISPGDKPKFYGGTMVVVAYRLLITGNFGDEINLNGNFWYRFSGTNYDHRFDYGSVRIQQNSALCESFSSASFTAESSFGEGIVQNRALAVNAPGYNKVNMAANDPADGNYAVANNTSTDGTISNSGPYKPVNNTHRVFGGYWDIIGDHTGAIDEAQGNLPVPPGINGGYMLVVNAAFPTGEAYRDNIQGLCPNTYYEFSAWVRNICKVCGIDSNSTSTYTPGVLPNLAFTINDVDYYNTGNIPYTGDWVKRGFIYKTGPTETSFNITIKNNAAGGGGNDWVLDDIKLATCYPNLIMNPSDTAKVCANSDVHLSDTVKSYFNNYNNYCWETSADGGISWTGTGVCGVKTPVLVNGLWEYVVDTVFRVAASDSGKLFRLKVATTTTNLTNPNCSVDQSQEVYMQVYNYDCSVLAGKFSNFEGVLKDERATLSWKTENEENIFAFSIEKSSDGVSFKEYAQVKSIHLQGGSYSYIDPVPVKGVNYYRIKLINSGARGIPRYSKIIALYNKQPVTIQTPNPFKNELVLDIISPEEGTMDLGLFDVYGKQVGKKSIYLHTGISKVTVEGVERLPSGIYILRGQINGQTVQLKLYKL